MNPTDRARRVITQQLTIRFSHRRASSFYTTPAASDRRGSSPTRPISSGPLPRSCRRVRTSDIQRSAGRRRRKDRVLCGTASCGPDTSGNAADRTAAAMVRNDIENWACDAPHFHGGSTTLSVTDGCRWDAVMEILDSFYLRESTKIVFERRHKSSRRFRAATLHRQADQTPAIEQLPQDLEKLTFVMADTRAAPLFSTPQGGREREIATTRQRGVSD
jgi:hypothetical protein